MGSLGELERTIENRAEWYGGARLRGVVAPHGESGDTFRGRLRFLQPGDEPQTVQRRYRDLRQIQASYDVEPALELLQRVFEKGELPFTQPPSDPEIYLRGPDTYHDGGWTKPIGRYGREEWPNVSFRLGGLDKPGYPSGPLLETQHPPLVDPSDELEAWMGLERSDLRDGGLEIVLPDYRARLASILFREDDVKIQPEGHIDPDRLQLRAAVYSREEGSTEVPVERTSDAFVAKTGRLPDNFYAFLTDVERSEPIDWCRINTNADREIPQVGFAQPEQKLRQRIDGGEQKTVEFKEQADDGARIVESVVAFANTEGGKILVGVDDHGRIEGIHDPSEIRGKVLNWIDAHCDPAIDVDFQTATLGGSEVLVVSVPEGPNPPYVHRGKGVVFVRRGSTDRRAGRSDIDELYEVTHGQGPGPGPRL